MVRLHKRSRPTNRRSRKRPRSRFADWWVIWRMPILLLIVMAVWWFGFRPDPEDRDWVNINQPFALCGERSTGSARELGCVVDGDTVVIGFGDNRRRIRLTGFDTPEMDGSCPAETALADRARVHLRQWLNEGAFEWTGGVDPPRDQYGRELREVRRRIDDSSREYLADTMIDAGLASDNGWGRSGEEWCP
ncbi:MAG: hypothetical protein ABJN35_11245 [Erythrobacter sp.]